jgi:cytoskeletal protein CcmA (bactofilin family)
MSYNQNIKLGPAPLLWSNLDDAFAKINQNFDIIGATILGGGGINVDFSTLGSNVTPVTTNSFGLGTDAKQWKALHLADASVVPGSEFNGLWLGAAQIKSASGIVDLPAGTTVAGAQIFDTNRTAFKTISVGGQADVVADSYTDTLTLAAGSAMSLTTDAASDTITFTNTGVTSLTGSGAVSVSNSTGAITITNTGVTRITAGAGMTIDNNTGNVTITNSGIRGIAVVTGLSLTIDATTKIATLNNTSPASALFTFRNLSVPGASLITASSSTDTLTMIKGYGIGITTVPLTKTMTISVDPKIDITGSVFSDNSSLLVDGTGARIVGDIYTSVLRTSETKITLGFGAGLTTQGAESVAVGKNAGNASQGNSAVAIGSGAGGFTQGTNAVAIGLYAGNYLQSTSSVAVGYKAGYNGQGANSIAIGTSAGETSQAANSIILNASGSALQSDGTSRFYVNPVRSGANTGNILQYNTSTKEITYGSTVTASLVGNVTGNVTGDLKGTVVADDSTILVDAVAGKVVGPIDTTTINVTGATQLYAVKKTYAAIAGATGTVIHDINNGDVFVHTGLQGNFNVDLYNLNLANGQFMEIKMILIQGVTARVPNAILINGSNTGITLNWENNVVITGNVNKKDLVTFSLYRNGSSYSVFGMLRTFG